MFAKYHCADTILQGSAIPRGFMGIVPTAPAYNRFTVKPQPGPVAEAQIILPTQSGSISASFKQNKDSFKLTLSPPANTLAKVCLPTLGIKSSTLTVDGKKAAATAHGDYMCVDGIGSSDTPRVISRP